MPFPECAAPVRVPFSKSTVFKICRQEMCRFRVNGNVPLCHISCRFQNVPASCERSLDLGVLFSRLVFCSIRLQTVVCN